MDALVTVILGKRYQSLYERDFRQSQLRYARKLGVPLIEIREPITAHSRFQHSHPFWQKLLIFEAEQTRPFDRLCWIDADIFVQKSADDLFQRAGTRWAAANNSQSAEADREDHLWHGYLPRHHRPQLLNSGLFVVNRRTHQPMMRFVHDFYGHHCEQGPLSYHLLALPGVLLENKHNSLAIQAFSEKGYGPLNLLRWASQNQLLHFSSPLQNFSAAHLKAVHQRDAGRLVDLSVELLKLVPFQLLVMLSHRLPRAVLRGALPWLDRLVPLPPSALARYQLRGLIEQRFMQSARPGQPLQLIFSFQERRRPGWLAVDPTGISLLNDHLSKFSSKERGVVFPLELKQVLELLGDGALERLSSEYALEALTSPEQGRHLQLAHRLLRPGGELRLVCASALHSEMLPKKLYGDALPDLVARCNRRFCIDEKRAVALAQQAGFRLLESHEPRLPPAAPLRPGDGEEPLPYGSFLLRLTR